MNLPATTSRVKYFAFAGGMDAGTPQISLPDGFAYDALNFDVGVLGGYRRINGYERYDGRSKPSNTYPGAYVGTTQREHAIENATAANTQRALITEVPGSGPVRGSVAYAGAVYAFRDNIVGTSCLMYRATAAGWVLVTTPTMTPGGKYKFVIHNFGGAVDTLMLYGVSGVDKGFYFNGTTLTKITTGMTADTPNNVIAHSGHLFFSFGASVQHSAIGDPTSWTPVLGASEIALGERVTGWSHVPGGEVNDALFISTENSYYILYGSSSGDWKLSRTSDKVGALEGSVQELSQVFFLAKNGVTSLQQSSAFGNFESGAFSQKVEAFLSSRYTKVVGSIISLKKNNYRVFFSDGYALSMTFSSQGISGFFPHYYGRAFFSLSSGFDATGNEIHMACGNDGFLYELDSGTSFDGDALPAKLNLGYSHFGSPRSRKRFRKAVIEIVGEGYCEFSARPSFGYDSTDIYQSSQQQIDTGLSISTYDEVSWDAFYFDGRTVDPFELELDGTASNVSLQFSAGNNYSSAFTLYAATIHFTPRRQLR